MILTFTAYVRRLLVIPLLLLCTVLMAAEAQDGEKITLNEKSTPMRKVFSKITSQTGIKFVYSNRLIDDQQPVNVQVKEATLEETLQQIFVGRKFEVQRTGPKSVVLVVKSPSASAADGNENWVEALPAKSASAARDNATFDLTGIVTDTAGSIIPGATVIVKGTNKATASNIRGQFFLQGVQKNMLLQISSIGFQTREMMIGSDAGISIKLLPAVNNLDETVITAYGSTTQRDNVGAITTIKGEQIQSLPNKSFDKSLQGLVPGLMITKGSGQPGSGLSNMVLRGIATGSDVSFGSTARNPLVVIDGIPVSQDYFGPALGANEHPLTNPLAQLNPADIESISILKDAVAIALYGSKASNGVILVTTKKGKIGKTVFSFTNQTDFSTRLSGNVDLLNQQEYLDLVYETYKNSDPSLTDQDILAKLKGQFPTKSDGSFYSTPDWHDAVFRDMAPSVSNQLTISGGNEKSTFYTNVEYAKQEGVIKKTGYDRTSFRLNLEQRPLTWFKFGLNSTFSYNKQDMTGTIGDGVELFSPLLPIRFEDGSYPLIYTAGSVSIQPNPAAVADYNMNNNIAYRGLAKAYGELRFLRYLTLGSSLGIDYMSVEGKIKSDPRFIDAAPAMISERNTRRTTIINTNTLRFDKSFNYDHTIGITLGEEAQVNNEKVIGASAYGTAETLPYYDQLTSPGYTISEVVSSSRKFVQFSLFGQLNYNYKSKYFLSTGLRKDATSKFGEQQRWGTYWSAGAGWLITAEKFVKEEMPWLNYLKLRGSMGVAGNSSALDEFIRFDRIKKVTYLNGLAMTFSGLGNPDVRWEKTFNWDAGLEMRILDEKLSLTADIYEKKTHDLLYQTNLPSIAGYAFVVDNVGDINNKGIEVSATVNVINNKAFTWTVGANWSTNANVLVKANVPLAALSAGVLANEEGRNFNSFYMPVWAGVNPADGKPQWLDDQGKPTSDYYGKAKKVFVGKPQPDGFGGLTNSFGYKGFSLSASVYYQYGVSIYNEFQGNFLLNDGKIPLINQLKNAQNYWKAPGDKAPNPRRTIDNIDNGNAPSTRYLFSGQYIRLSNLKLGYSFPKKIISPFHVSTLNLFLQVNNLLTITNFSGPDPDNVNVGGSVRNGYPNEQTFSFGLNVSFN